ncbi:MAG: fructose-bisphosphatase [Ignavibacteria bacterium GWA2_55_11]|nr:MAG: fructose-bisphosphatase [Ignavibacteria bacterium GWA2_55_11]OGU47335.1 MAG: fructose-bisphosphatase [Ignavibacteria bacterium GWC2_56_12]OGU74003.1 MAG: fructose-bisphosphatase [Ignavibacteria bacterium RIFCSPLOWO2_02_FULL_55_14]OGU75519.1 MAG: fructose-bisphosphatase [Ignavibacteria bacterium RIFCSPLOWO2_12_FULL_56_21]HAV22464.1 class 1 fructose-bisphosphatase [Bacteroidota bacterium]
MAFQQKVVTIERHITEEERNHPGATGDFSSVLRDLTLAIKVIWREVSKAGLVNILGLVGKENVHGEQVKKLDVFADEKIYQAMDHGGHLCVMASEENEDILHIPDKYPTGKYVLLYDPLDGSSNIDANVNIGTIFSIYRRVTPSGKGTMLDCLQPGYKQVAAGYVVYGSSTMFVYTTGDGVHGFTLDPSIGEFLLSHENIRIPRRGKIYSVNEGNYRWWHDGMKQYVKYLQEEDEATSRPYSGRYIGSMVADIHRTLLYGGIFMYPGDKKHLDGKLRLMYEANPMSFIMEQAGGRASNGVERMMDVQPQSLHQRTPFFIGSEEDVAECEEFLQGKRLVSGTAQRE